ncbi:patatin-like phospholipase family protein [Henriciella marina]|uniref:patatin-like phospholipase family protein n=1 Tax=Henriciella marina TaxID=453851 RepID=UPI00035FAD63|nr:patatin-like phospholipase family protein [Henriciella marina]
MARSPAKAKPVSLALQGGGAHGAFTWGVLERLSECETLDIQAITATSAGAMNAVAYLSGLKHGGKAGARAALETFWKSMANKGRVFNAMPASSLGSEMMAANPFTAWTPHSFAAAMSAVLSPYDLNVFDVNPLKDAVAETVDFEAVRTSGVQLFIAATNVETGRVRIFKEDEITIDAVLASACLPQTFKAVEIGGTPYWDGGYLGNPSLFPLFYTNAPNDIVLVTLNPIKRDGTPRTAGEIQDRLNEITFNASLMGELRSIAFVQKLLNESLLNKAVRSQYRNLNIHAIRGGEVLCDLRLETKYDTSWRFLTELREKGREHAQTWLDTCQDSVGRSSSIDIHETFLDS